MAKMKVAVTFVVFALALITASSTRKQVKIVGGNVAMISQYPSTVALLYTLDSTNFYQSCVGTILTAKVIVTAGHCLEGDPVTRWRARVGSSWANIGGTVHILNSILIHPSFHLRTMDSDIAMVRAAVPFTFSNLVKPVSIAGATYKLLDSEITWAVGFGSTNSSGSEQLRHIQFWTISQATCGARYSEVNSNVTSNMVCAGLLNIASGTQCLGDSGGPLFHRGVLVGICSWGYSCANSQFPGINTRISQFTTWLQTNVYILNKV